MIAFIAFPLSNSRQDLRPVSRLRLGKEPMAACCKAAKRREHLHRWRREL